ncbi:transmembrane protein 192 isoform X3 [Canis lupus familiaris]|uniref:transmembrane protein 192 isoform X3 n=1 Tax=Canis lupus familiaris TaxID=9615 RepID=UPI0018F56457|nr:transmembrane protein 192 isoform X3 [Canis lupus familiaris]
MAARGRMEDGSLDLTQSIEDDPLLDTHHLPHHSLHAHFRPRFHPLPTVIIANLLLLIHVVFVILAFLTGILCSYPNPIEDKCPGNYTNPLKVQTVIILGKVILWILHFLLERYIQYHHNKVRNRGYTMIYLSTRHLKGLTLLIHSTGRFLADNKRHCNKRQYHKRKTTRSLLACAWERTKKTEQLSKMGQVTTLNTTSS